LVLLCSCLVGCVERRLMIRTNPPGATVYVDGYELGTTPISASFIYYGTRQIKMVKDGYETLTVLQPIPPPWYEVFPAEFVSENMVPGQLRDMRTFSYQLTPQVVIPGEQLVGRAEQLRRSAPRAGTLPPGAEPPPPGAIPPIRRGAPAGIPPQAVESSPTAAGPPMTAPETMPGTPQGFGGQPVRPVGPQ
jgi:hypothetical protein